MSRSTTGVERVQRRELRIQRRGEMGDLGLEGGLAIAASPPSTSLLENVGNLGVPRITTITRNEIRPVKIPNCASFTCLTGQLHPPNWTDWTSCHRSVRAAESRDPPPVRVCRTEPHRGANPHPRGVAVSPPDPPARTIATVSSAGATPPGAGIQVAGRNQRVHADSPIAPAPYGF